jgi:hypothetical protein
MVKDSGGTNTAVGRRANMHPARVGQIINGRVVPPRNSVELVRLAIALEYHGDPNDLLDPVDEPAPAEAARA